MCILYAQTMGGDTVGTDWQEGIEGHVDTDTAYARALDIQTNLDALDGVLAKFSTQWRLGRLARVDLAILRLALYEMANRDLPPAVVINEAVNLSKKYGSNQSPVFVNGILSAWNKQRGGSSDNKTTETLSESTADAPSKADPERPGEVATGKPRKAAAKKPSEASVDKPVKKTKGDASKAEAAPTVEPAKPTAKASAPRAKSGPVSSTAGRDPKPVAAIKNSAK